MLFMSCEDTAVCFSWKRRIFVDHVSVIEKSILDFAEKFGALKSCQYPIIRNIFRRSPPHKTNLQVAFMVRLFMPVPQDLPRTLSILPLFHFLYVRQQRIYLFLS